MTEDQAIDIYNRLITAAKALAAAFEIAQEVEGAPATEIANAALHLLYARQKCEDVVPGLVELGAMRRPARP